MQQPLVTILVPHYKTLELTKLCLGLIKKYTDIGKAKVIVIDNDSQDESTRWLRAVDWIELIERPAVAGQAPVQAHSEALDLALARVTTPYVLSIHTDTLVKRRDWLEFLLSQIEGDDNRAGVGSWKLEAKPLYRRVAKQIERVIQLAFYRLIGKKQHGIQGVGKNYYYLRSHCALYRMALLRQYNLHFSDGDMVAGKAMHKTLVDAGHHMVFVPSEILLPYLDHVNHATVILNPHLSTRQNKIDKKMERVRATLEKLSARLAD